jgi:3-oxoacyl-[acyl-carrier-protein] synthase II
MGRVVITGTGVVTPLGDTPAEILRRIEAGEAAARRPTGFDPAPFSCPSCAEIPDFRPEQHVPEPKAVRLMNRDTLLAVAAAGLAIRDAGVTVGKTYPGEDIALYGATGMAGLPLAEVSPLVTHAASDGRFDPQRFGAVTLKRVRPVLSFKILSNMPVCFVSIFAGLRGPNAVYNPWEGQGAHAIIAGAQAVARGRAACALVGGCDVKTHELAFVALEQHGVFRPWREQGAGPVPGEGAAFLVLEDEQRARARGAPLYARIADWRTATVPSGDSPAATYENVVAPLAPSGPSVLISAADGEPARAEAEAKALASCGVRPTTRIAPKQHVGNLFAAAAALQVALAAAFARSSPAGARVLAGALGFGSEQAAFLLEAV